MKNRLIKLNILLFINNCNCATTATASLSSGSSLDWLTYLIGSIFGVIGLFIIGMVIFIFYKRRQIKVYEEIIRLKSKEKLKNPTVISQRKPEDKPSGIKFIKLTDNKIHSIEHLPMYFQVKPIWYTVNPQIHNFNNFRQIKDTNKISIVAYDTPHVSYIEEISLA